MADTTNPQEPTPIPTPLNVTVLAKRHGVSRTIQRRLRKGWTPDATQPRRRARHKVRKVSH